MTRFNPYEEISKKFIEYFENEESTFCPHEWARTGVPRNLHTGRTYNGVNVLLLWMAMEENEWENSLFATFRQIAEISKMKKFEDETCLVRKGSKGTSVCFWKPIEETHEKDDEEITIKRAILRLYRVFNIDQIECSDKVREYLEKHTLGIGNDDDPIGRIDEFIKNIGSPEKFGGDIAAYNWAKDLIKMPHKKKFASIDSYYSVRFHEEVHRTGRGKDKGGLDRDIENRFGTDKYAFEELIAELGAAFLCADFGIKQDEWRKQAEYVSVWCRRMKEDSGAIFRAAGDASRAVAFLHELQPEKGE